MWLHYFHVIFVSHDALYFVMCISSSCSKTPTQHDAATPYFIVGVLKLASFFPFPPNVKMVIMAKHFSFIRPQDTSLKIKVFALSAFAFRVMASSSTGCLSVHV
ncbi:hypothetical protein GOODEAATRI_031487 [Goodea atripinnis]|uniref:Secreted protein n=1 Tax=Goodea atripinnis TaxID=208336 RepID=A0ABV0Q2P6_9TELE